MSGRARHDPAAERLIEPAREIPVTHSVDVVVAGAGPSGLAAAVTAARCGLSVVLVEATAVPGGMVTHVTQWLNDFATKGGFAREYLQFLENRHLYEKPYYNPFHVTPYFDRLIEDAGVRPLYLCLAVAPVVENRTLKGLIVESKQGRHAIRARIVIDATGDGDVAARAGARFLMGRPGDGACQAISLSHMWSNFQGPALTPDEFQRCVNNAAGRAGASYRLPYDRARIRPVTGTAGTIWQSIPHVTGQNPLKAEGISDALVALRRQATELYEMLKAHAPEFASIEYGPFSGLPGVRESRRICCDCNLTGQDILSGSRFPDGLFLVTMNVDIHKPTEAEPAIRGAKVTPYHIPYRALLPEGLDNILVAGRCIGGDHEALASYRVIADCMGMGEAAALAADLAIRSGCDLRAVDVPRLTQSMCERGYQQ